MKFQPRLAFLVGLVWLAPTASAVAQRAVVTRDAAGKPLVSLPASVKARLTVEDKGHLCAGKIALAPAAGTKAGEGSPGEINFDVSRVASGTTLQLMCNGKSVGKFTADTATAPTEATAGRNTLPDCSSAITGSQFYFREKNEAIFGVDLLGRVLARPELPVDEDDTVIVRVAGPKDRLESVVVRRASQTRTPVESRVIGVEKEAARAPGGAPGPCRTKDFPLGDFQPGEGKFEIVEKQETDGKLEETVRGTVTFTVTPLYTGYFSFAALATRAVDPTFTIVRRGDKLIVSAGDEREWNYRYVVFFTPYLWKRRDIEKGPDKPWHRINPSVGIALKNFSDNVFVGLSADIGTGAGLGLSAMGGVHFAHVHELDPNAGLTVGGEFHGDATATLPTAQRWTGKLFVAIGFDMRAMLKLISTAAGVK